MFKSIGKTCSKCTISPLVMVECPNCHSRFLTGRATGVIECPHCKLKDNIYEEVN